MFQLGQLAAYLKDREIFDGYIGPLSLQGPYIEPFVVFTPDNVIAATDEASNFFKEISCFDVKTMVLVYIRRFLRDLKLQELDLTIAEKYLILLQRIESTDVMFIFELLGHVEYPTSELQQDMLTLFSQERVMMSYRHWRERHQELNLCAELSTYYNCLKEYLKNIKYLRAVVVRGYGTVTSSVMLRPVPIPNKEEILKNIHDCEISKGSIANLTKVAYRVRVYIEIVIELRCNVQSLDFMHELGSASLSLLLSNADKSSIDQVVNFVMVQQEKGEESKRLRYAQQAQQDETGYFLRRLRNISFADYLKRCEQFDSLWVFNDVAKQGYLSGTFKIPDAAEPISCFSLRSMLRTMIRQLPPQGSSELNFRLLELLADTSTDIFAIRNQLNCNGFLASLVSDEAILRLYHQHKSVIDNPPALERIDAYKNKLPSSDVISDFEKKVFALQHPDELTSSLCYHLFSEKFEIDTYLIFYKELLVAKRFLDKLKERRARLQAMDNLSETISELKINALPNQQKATLEFMIKREEKDVCDAFASLTATITSWLFRGKYLFLEHEEVDILLTGVNETQVLCHHVHAQWLETSVRPIKLVLNELNKSIQSEHYGQSLENVRELVQSAYICEKARCQLALLEDKLEVLCEENQDQHPEIRALKGLNLSVKKEEVTKIVSMINGMVADNSILDDYLVIQQRLRSKAETIKAPAVLLEEDEGDYDACRQAAAVLGSSIAQLSGAGGPHGFMSAPLRNPALSSYDNGPLFQPFRW